MIAYSDAVGIMGYKNFGDEGPFNKFNNTKKKKIVIIFQLTLLKGNWPKTDNQMLTRYNMDRINDFASRRL